MALSTSFVLARLKAPSIEDDRDPNEPLPWPDNMIMYVPTHSQMTAENLAWCSAIASILDLCNLDYQVQRCSNYDYLAPTKLYPVIRSGNGLAAGFENILFYIKGLGSFLLPPNFLVKFLRRFFDCLQVFFIKKPILIHFECDNLELRYTICSHCTHF